MARMKAIPMIAHIGIAALLAAAASPTAAPDVRFNPWWLSMER